MDLVFFKVQGGNFGDDLNEWFWDELLPGFRSWRSDTVLVGVGTILKKGLLPAGRRKLVVGSGVGYGESPNIHADPTQWDIRCVRGPRTAARLGIDPKHAIADPAVLLPQLAEFSGIARGGETLFIPHHSSLKNFDWARICDGTGVAPVSPATEAKVMIRRIAGAKRVIAESMHGAIIADAFGVPWRSVAVSRAFNDFKWGDWAESLDLELGVRRFFPLIRKVQEARSRFRAGRPAGPSADGRGGGGEGLPRWMPPILAAIARRTLIQVARSDEFSLSSREVLAQKTRRLREVLDEIRRDHAA